MVSDKDNETGDRQRAEDLADYLANFTSGKGWTEADCIFEALQEVRAEVQAVAENWKACHLRDSAAVTHWSAEAIRYKRERDEVSRRLAKLEAYLVRRIGEEAPQTEHDACRNGDPMECEACHDEEAQSGYQDVLKFLRTEAPKISPDEASVNLAAIVKALNFSRDHAWRTKEDEAHECIFDACFDCMENRHARNTVSDITDILNILSVKEPEVSDGK